MTVLISLGTILLTWAIAIPVGIYSAVRQYSLGDYFLTFVGFIEWFNESKRTVPLLTRAGIAHAYFVSIHPFEDGNGRIGRALSEKAMAEKLGKPTLIALAQTIEKNRKDYYDALHLINRTNLITAWLRYFANLVLGAQVSTTRQVEFIIAKANFFDRHGDHLKARQSKVINRIFREGPEGFVGGVER